MLDSTLSYVYLMFFFFFNDTATTEIYTLSLHDALPICRVHGRHVSVRHLVLRALHGGALWRLGPSRSEEHTSELQSPCNLVCRLLLEKKKKRRTVVLSRIFSTLDVEDVLCPMVSECRTE